VDHPVDSGDTPRFALFAHANPACAALIARHRDLLEPEPRPPFGEDGIWLVRPDGYVALAAASNEWNKISAYFDQVGLH